MRVLHCGGEAGCGNLERIVSMAAESEVEQVSEKKQPERPGVVELRSDALEAAPRRAWDTPQWWWVIGGAVVLVFVVGAVLWAALRAGREPAPPETFGALPEAKDSDSAGLVSGLSGRSCEGADRRAIGVMLSSDLITRPVSGFAAADMVFELPVLVSDVTRLLAVYQCGRPEDIGSVRSARHDYLFLAEGVDAVLGHWGGSYHALNRIRAGEFETIDALGNPFGAYYRKNHLPAPYNGFATYDNLWGALQKLNYRTTTKFAGYPFKDDVPAEQRPVGGTLSIGWPGAFRVHYEYGPATNRYVRYWGGSKQVDGGPAKEEVAPSVVAVMRATNRLAAGEGGYNEVAVEGEGDAEVYQDGTVIRGRWRKDERYKSDPVHWLDAAGQPITFTRGQVWVMVVEPTVSVTWEEIRGTPSPSVAAAPSPSS